MIHFSTELTTFQSNARLKLVKTKWRLVSLDSSKVADGRSVCSCSITSSKSFQQVIYDINQRINLIECFITRRSISMHKYRPFLALMVKLKDELQQIMLLGGR